MTAVKKDPKTTVSDISNNLQRAGVKVSQSTVRRRLHEQKYRGYTRRCKPLISKKNRRRASKFWDKVYGLILWTKVMERLKFGEKRICSWSQTYKLIWNTVYTGVHYSTHYTGNVMAWAFIASSGTGSLIFINDVTHDGSSKINSEVYRNIVYIYKKWQKHIRLWKIKLKSTKFENIKIQANSN